MGKLKSSMVEVILAFATWDEHHNDMWACCLCDGEPLFEEEKIEGHLFEKHHYAVKESAFTVGVLIHHIQIPFRAES